jgi:uncharacterized protein involved in cysteine biosynthesis
MFARNLPGTPTSSLLAGLRSPPAGFVFLLKHRSLWQYAIWPVLLNLVITGAVSLMLVIGTVVLFRNLPSWIPEADYRILRIIAAGIGIVVAAIGVAIATWLLFQVILCSYFYCKLTYRVEMLIGTSPKLLHEAPLHHQFIDVLIDVIMMLIINLACLALNLIPVFGTIVGLVVGIYYSSLILGRQCLDYPLSLRGLRRSGKLAVSRRYRWETIGLGAEVLVFLPIPVVGSVCLVAAIVGAVLLHRDHQMTHMTAAVRAQ